MMKGHTLIVPKVETDRFFDVDDKLPGEWLVFAKPIAKAIEKAYPCNRVGISVMGLEVPHAHMHLVPINSADDLNFTRPKLKLSSEDFRDHTGAGYLFPLKIKKVYTGLSPVYTVMNQ
ncbi:HIT family protein [Chitinophaga sedimenti]|uniref:HIT family protein n=1 Tax=Chitinophaga sedimenti TaxID=2033606 RepID=UPI0020042B6C|nr:HIT family protein [Chitinophaga sedimenti]MCK7559180.1 HIT family protein [Chitinophaga sedimenti]